MSHNEQPPARAHRGLEKGIDSCEGVINSPPRPDTQLELPRVAEARARDQLARARLRGLIPRTMLHLEHGRAGKRAAEEMRREVFGPPPKEEGE